MSGRRLVAVVLVVVLGPPASAQAAAAANQLVRPGIGIGKLRLGMTLTQVKHVLGPNYVVNRRIPRGFGRTYVELGWDFSWWRVGFLVQRGRYRAVVVATQYRSERTRNGVGVGTSLATLKRKLAVHCPRWRPHPALPGFGVCTLGLPTRRHTAFGITSVCTRSLPVVAWRCPDRWTRTEVAEVAVLEPF
jgi:hypothetical protein